MAVSCANDVSGTVHRDDSQQSPVLHTAIHNLLDGLKNREEIEVEVIYGRMHPKDGEDRREGAIHYVPVPYKPLPIPGMGGPYLARTWALLRHIQKVKPDLVHGQGTERESGLVAALSGRPSVLTLHGNFREIAKTLKTPPWNYHSINAMFETFTIPRVGGVICISNYTKKLVQDLNQKLWVLPNAVNEKMFEIERLPVEGRVVCIAGISARKNQTNLLLQCDNVFSTHPSFKLHFWGPGNAEAPYDAEFFSNIGRRPWASYCGNAPVEQIPAILSEASILVLPSIEDNCPVAILEAMAVGVPVVASSVGGIPDLVEEGKTGLLVLPSEPSGYAKAIQRMLNSPEERASFSRLARAKALREYTPAAIGRAHVAIYQELLHLRT